MTALKRIFISRDLTPDSTFQALLEGQAILQAQSLISFEEVPIQQLPVCDWLFFYSKKGLDFGWASLQQLVPFPKVAVLGPASGKHLKHKFGKVADFVGTGEPITTAAAFSKAAKGQQVCFVRAKNSQQSIAQLLGEQVQATSLVVYTNVAKTSLSIPFCDILVFTSPLNAQTYYQHYVAKKDQTVIAIGQTTANALDSLGITTVIMASTPHESALANCCLSLL